jgi:hypothetical protein
MQGGEALGVLIILINALLLTFYLSVVIRCWLEARAQGEGSKDEAPSAERGGAGDEGKGGDGEEAVEPADAEAEEQRSQPVRGTRPL